MPENNPNTPGGALPPKPSDSKVLPKKETVRINLPPKPSAAPTIKLPTLPPGGPSTVGAPGAPATSAPRATSAPATSAPVAAPRPAATASPARQQPRPAVATVSGLDKVLAIAALVAALVAIGSTLYVAGVIPGVPVAYSTAQ